MPISWNEKRIYFLILVGFSLITAGCTPSIHEAVKILYSVPLGVSREEVVRMLGETYTKPRSAPPGYGGDLNGPAGLRDELGIQDDKNVLAVYSKKNDFTCIYPTNLFDKLPKKVYYDDVIVREVTQGGGFLAIYYDENTNYVGFAGASHK